LAGRVPLCKVCDSGGEGVGKDSTASKDRHKAKKKKRKTGGWDDDDSEGDEPDLPDYPPGIMKVFRPPSPTRTISNEPSSLARTA
jgi:NAD-dependent histone deacetylase SIR2